MQPFKRYRLLKWQLSNSRKVWWRESLANLTNCSWFTKLSPSKLVLTINSLLTDLLIHQTFFHQMLKKGQFTKLSRYNMVTSACISMYFYINMRTWSILHSLRLQGGVLYPCRFPKFTITFGIIIMTITCTYIKKSINKASVQLVNADDASLLNYICKCFPAWSTTVTANTTQSDCFLTFQA